MTDAIKRYDAVFSEYLGGGIGAKENGKYCEYADYLAVLKRAEAAEIKLAERENDQEPIGRVVLGEVSDSNEYPDARVVCLHDQADWHNFADGTELFLHPAACTASVKEDVKYILAAAYANNQQELVKRCRQLQYSMGW